MKTLRAILLAAALTGAAQAASAQDNSPAPTLAPNPRGVYATINMRPTQEMVQRLSAAYGSDRRMAIREVQRSASSYMPPVLYALANTLTEDASESAIFWYHVGRVRAVYDSLRMRDKTAAQLGMQEMRRTLNPELMKNQFYRRDRLVALARKAIDWDLNNPRDYDQRWIALYGKVAHNSAGADPSEVMVPESEWPAILKRVHAAHLKSVEEFVSEKK